MNVSLLGLRTSSLHGAVPWPMKARGPTYGTDLGTANFKGLGMVARPSKDSSRVTVPMAGSQKHRVGPLGSARQHRARTTRWLLAGSPSNITMPHHPP